MKELIPRFIIEQHKKKKLNGSFKAFGMFLDISGFTDLTETLMRHKKDGAEVLTEVLDKIFTPIVKKIYSKNGTVTTFAGDALTAIFGRNISAVLECSLDISYYVKKNGIIKTKYGNFNIGIKIGLSYGKVNWGIIGGDLKTFYFCGEAVNGAAESEHRAEINSIVADKNFIEKAGSCIIKSIPIGREHFKITGNVSGSSICSVKAVRQRSVKKELAPFVTDSILNFKRKAEFREVISVFVTYDGKDMKSTSEFITLLLEESLKFGGYFNKADFGDKGNIALIIFGAPVSYENNTERALNFILNIKHRAKGSFRSGIASGTVYAGFTGGRERSEYTVIGDIVNLSSRLVMSASQGCIQVSRNIRKDAGPDFVFRSEGRKKFKGKSESISVYSLTGRRLVSSSIFKGKMVGRDHEISLLEDFVRPLRSDRFAGIIYIYGEPGIGKSRLVHEFRSGSGSISNHKWILWPCEEILRKSFNPVIHFLKNYFSISDGKSNDNNRKNFEKVFSDLINRIKSAIGKKTAENVICDLKSGMSVIGGFLGIEWKNSLFATLDPRDRYDNFLFAVKDLIKAESMLQPVIISIDDAHLADNDTKELISLLCRNIEEHPVALICTSRYDDSGAEFRFIIDNEVPVNKIDLNYLDKNDTENYCMAILDTNAELSDKLTELVFSKSSGNPFFMEQIILDLRDQGMIIKKNGELTVKKGSWESIPANIQAVLISRLDRLSVDIKNIVQTASVLGREFIIQILSGILKSDSELLLKIKDAEKESIWSPLSEMNYIFKHALMRDAAYDMQLRSRHKKLHKLAASSYLNMFGDNLKEYYNDIAYHFEKAGDIRNAAEFLEKAADQSAKNFKNDEALYTYDKLLDLSENIYSEKNRIKIMIKKGEVLDNLCNYEASCKLFSDSMKMAEKIKDGNLMTDAYIHLGNNYRFTSKLDKAMKQFGKALKMSESAIDKIGMIRAYNHIAIVHYLKSEYDRSMDYSQKQYEMSMELDDITGINEAIGNMGLIYSDTGKYEKALDCFNLLLSNSRKGGLKVAEAVTIGNIGTIYENQGHYSKALECYNRQYELSIETGNKGLIGKTVNNIGIIHWRNGEFDKAIKNFKISLHISLETGDRRSAGISSCNIGSMYHKQGFFKKALEYYEIDHKVARELGDKRSESIVLSNKGKVYFATGEYGSAMKYYDRSIQIANELKIDRLLYNFYLSKAELLYFMGDYKKASMFIKEAKKIAEENHAENSIYNKIVLYTHKIAFRQSKNIEIMNTQIDHLKIFLNDLSEPADIASFCFEISRMLNEIGYENSEYRKKALEIYRNLVRRTPDYEYIANLKILESE